jgi:hypothetical protein
MADWQSERDLFRAPLQAKAVSNLILNNGVRYSSIKTYQGLLLTKQFSFSGSVTAATGIARNLSTDSRFVGKHPTRTVLQTR